MIVSVTEIYEDEQPVHWFCDYDKASIDWRTVLDHALKDAFRSCATNNFDLGFQGADKISGVKPPCMVDHEVAVYFESR